MKPKRDIESEARVQNLRLRLGLVDLAGIESWAEQALKDDSSIGELFELRTAQKAGETLTLVGLIAIGDEPEAADIVRTLGAMKSETLTQDQLRRLADSLDPVLQEMNKRHGLPDLLQPALAFSSAFWRARTQSQGTAETVEADMRKLLRTLQQRGADEERERKRTNGANDPPSVSAVVVSYRTGDVLFDCLQALVVDPDVAEIVLVDNGNPPNTLWKVDERFGPSGKLKITGGGENRGFAAGVNLGAKLATGNRLLILNPDAILQPGSIAALETARAGQAEPVIVGGKIHGMDGVEQRGARRRRLTLRSAAVTFLGMGWLRSVNPAFVNINRHTEPEPAGPVPMDAVSGALMYLSRPGFERLGGFDEGYFLHVEDLDLCRRAEADGGAVIYTPLARALHHGATSDAPAVAVEQHKAAGLRRYFSKFAETQAERTAAMILAPLISLALVLRARLRKR
ncbi:MAG TPA: glycosyltransferase family 2 protein [Hyphomonadaceae bacterium]|nr:glycosyltransferase family 2 protein [Hyphomonadaceae bacterium]